MENAGLLTGALGDVSETLLITLFCRALESAQKEPFLVDNKAVEIADRLRPELAASQSRLRRDLACGRIKRELRLYIALRAKRYDQYAEAYLSENPRGVIVNLGCGLDTRFHRIDNGKLTLYDLDLPEVIRLKEGLVEQTGRYHFIPSSVLSYSWMDRIKERHSGPFLFLAEGLFMYLQQEDVKKLVAEMHNSFPGSELVCEMANSIILKTPLREIARFKLRRQMHLGAGAYYSSGISDGREVERWTHGIKYLGDWSLFDEKDRLPWHYRLLGKIPLFRKMQWTVRYRL